jgi:hypothetical protein
MKEINHQNGSDEIFIGVLNAPIESIHGVEIEKTDDWNKLPTSVTVCCGMQEVISMA